MALLITFTTICGIRTIPSKKSLFKFLFLIPLFLKMECLKFGTSLIKKEKF